MKRGAIFLIGLVLVVLALGQDSLPYSRDIEDLELMRVMGIDQGEKTEDGLKVTMVGGDQSTGKEGESQKPVALSQEAATLSKACTIMKSYGEKFISYGHITQCLVGEEAAGRDLVQLLDYYERDIELRLNAPLYIVRGGTAGEVLEGGGEEEGGTVIKRLESIEIDTQFQSDTSTRTVKDVLGQLSENGCALVPALTLMEEGETGENGAGQQGQGGQGSGGSDAQGQGESGGGAASPAQGEQQEGGEASQGQEETKKTIQTAGYAVFRENRLTGFLEEGEARGANFLMDEIYGGILELELKDGSLVSVQLLDSHCEWHPGFRKDGSLERLTAELKVEGSLNEIMGNADPMDKAVLDEMEAQAEEQIRQMAAGVLARSQEERTDFLHLKRTIGVLRPDRWYQLQEEWETVFPDLDWRVEVTMHLRRTYDVDRPLEGGNT